MPGKPRLSIRWQGFGVPKRGHSAEEYEDAYAAALQVGRFAVADGASESSFASLWASCLSRASFILPGRGTFTTIG